MGNILYLCPCQKREDDDDNGDTRNSSLIPCKKFSNDKYGLLSNASRIPSSVIDVKIKTQNLIIKRNENAFIHYENISKLGEGAYGVVYKVKHRTSGIIRAMKEIPKENISSTNDSNEFINEINILRRLDHPNIMKIYEFYEDKDSFFIITEFCDQGNLTEAMQNVGVMTEFLVKFIMHHVFSAVSYLHTHRIIHGDIKLENILLFSTSKSNELSENFGTVSFESKQSDVQNELRHSIKKKYSVKTKNYLKKLTEYEIKMIDFGCSKFFHRKKLSGIIGTSVYCSPEVIDDNYREECDEWACGVLMYILLSGDPPFKGNDEEELFNHIKKGHITFPSVDFKKISPECIELMKLLLNKDPEKRITAREAMKHPFFTDNVDMNELLTEEADLGLLNELKNTKQPPSKFQEAMLAYIALNYVDKDEEKRIKNLFRFINKDEHTFHITKEEFTKCLKDNNIDLTDMEIEEKFDSIDSDKNGYLEYQEVIRALCDKETLLQEKNLREAFDFIDVDKSQAITWDEIGNVIFAGNTVADKLMNQFLEQIGKSKDDEINFEEFCNIMRQ